MFMASLLILLTYKLSFSSMNPVKNRSLHSVICVIMVSFHTFKGTLSPGTAKTPPAQRGGNWKILGSWKQSKKRVKIFIANFQKSHPKYMSYHWASFSDMSLHCLCYLFYIITSRMVKSLHPYYMHRNEHWRLICGKYWIYGFLRVSRWEIKVSLFCIEILKFMFLSLHLYLHRTTFQHWTLFQQMSCTK